MTTPTASTPAAAPALPAEVMTAWQDALAVEHAAVFGYAVLGPRLATADQPVARTDEAAHRLLRDATAAAISAAGSVPVRSLDDYPLPFAVNAPSAAGRLALRLEDACASAWRYLLATAAQPGSTTAPTPSAGGVVSLFSLRASALVVLTASSVRAQRWRTRTTPAAPFDAFPGISG